MRRRTAYLLWHIWHTCVPRQVSSNNLPRFLAARGHELTGMHCCEWLRTEAGSLAPCVGSRKSLCIHFPHCLIRHRARYRLGQSLRGSVPSALFPCDHVRK